jgi:hypothetical protein
MTIRVSGVNFIGSCMLEINVHVGKMESVELPKVTEDIPRFAEISGFNPTSKSSTLPSGSLTGWIKKVDSRVFSRAGFINDVNRVKHPRS